MANCKKCGHPHGWYQGLCRPCAVEAGIALVPAPEEARVEIGSVAPESEVITGTTTETIIEPEVESVPEVEKPKPSRRTSTRRAKK